MIRYRLLPAALTLLRLLASSVLAEEPVMQRLCDVTPHTARRYRPVIIGEFHFGALDHGMFHPGLKAARDQTHRGELYRAYVAGANYNRLRRYRRHTLPGDGRCRAADREWSLRVPGGAIRLHPSTHPLPGVTP